MAARLDRAEGEGRSSPIASCKLSAEGRGSIPSVNHRRRGRSMLCEYVNEPWLGRSTARDEDRFSRKALTDEFVQNGAEDG